MLLGSQYFCLKMILKRFPWRCWSWKISNATFIQISLRSIWDEWAQRRAPFRGGSSFQSPLLQPPYLARWLYYGNFKVEVIYYVGSALGTESVFFEREQTQSGVESTCFKPWPQSSHSSSLGGTWAFSPQHICFSAVALCKLPLTVTPQNPDQSM